MNFDECLKSKNILYVSDKDYKKLFQPIFVVISIVLAVWVIFLFLYKNLFFADLAYHILELLLIILVLIIVEYVTNKKVIITSKEILCFNFRGKLIKKFILNQKIVIISNDYCFDIQDENKNKIKICLERNHKNFFKILKESGNVSISDYSINKFLVYFSAFLILVAICFIIYNRNEVLSYYYINKGNIYFEKEVKHQNSKFGIRFEKNVEENLQKTYEYYKKACSLYPKQDAWIYFFIIEYAKKHNINKDYEIYSKIYP